jgi:hypothetical protein
MGAPAVEQLHIEEYRRLLELMWPEGLSIPRDSWHVFMCALSCKNTKKKKKKKERNPFGERQYRVFQTRTAIRLPSQSLCRRRNLYEHCIVGMKEKSTGKLDLLRSQS